MFDYTHQYEMSVLVNGKTQADEYYHTDGNTYIEAREGSEYDLVLRNNSSERVMMVPAVDGLSTIDGQKAGIDSPGFIVEAHNEIHVPGWSKSEDEVAKFVFWDKKNSYSKRTGRGTSNVGVMGCLVFREQVQVAFAAPTSFYTQNRMVDGGNHTGTPAMDYTYTTSSADNMIIGATAESVSLDLDTEELDGVVAETLGTRHLKKSQNIQEAGTGHGRREQFNVSEVQFQKRDAQHPDGQVVLYYDTSRGLERRGIILRYKKNFAPDPFPRSPGSTRSYR